MKWNTGYYTNILYREPYIFDWNELKSVWYLLKSSSSKSSLKHSEKIIKQLGSNIGVMQRHIQNPVKHPGQSIQEWTK